MKVVYIAHPLRGDWEANVAKARTFANAALRAGYAPVAPYLMGLPLDDRVEGDRALGLSHDMAVIPKCEELWVCGGRISEGVAAEIALATELRIPVRFVHVVEEIGPGRV